MNRYIEMLRKILPSGVNNSDEREIINAANFLFIAVNVAVFLGIYTEIYYLNGIHELVALCSSMWFMSMFAIYIYYATSSLEFATYLLLFASYIAITSSSVYTGGLAGPGVVWFGTAMVVGSYILSRRAYLVWGGIICLTTLVFFFNDFFGLHIKNILGERLNYWITGFSVVGSGIVLFIFSLSTRFVREIALRIEEEKNEEIRVTVASLENVQASLEESLQQNISLVRVLGHDLATPLSVIEGTLTLIDMQTESVGEEVMGALSPQLQRISRASKNMREIITHVKDLQAIRSGKKNLELGPVCVEDAIENAQFMFKDKLAEKQIHFVLNKQNDRDKTFIWAETISFSNNVMNNLISNAIKFSQPGAVIEIALKETVDCVEISVRDHGVGMDSALMSALFNVNKQTSRLGTAGEKGTGFGMPLVKSYLDIYGAKISVESKSVEQYPVDHGTVFKLTFEKKRESDGLDGFSLRKNQPDVKSVEENKKQVA